MGKSTISIAIFNSSYVKLPEGISHQGFFEPDSSLKMVKAFCFPQISQIKSATSHQIPSSLRRLQIFWWQIIQCLAQHVQRATQLRALGQGQQATRLSLQVPEEDVDQTLEILKWSLNKKLGTS